ncbi:tRNA pseudouridine synthase D [Diplogelasinospora grovesii]|uniref:tRNA pseudouridine synthase D n=1 Tax=Diplogelasinospora grovesii TaxID=303347 RepID=A0AAN6NBJ7_9PEZI|nr:tRNA pseudouridine synthase D [Diplogelasinospora grovesii]
MTQGGRQPTHVPAVRAEAEKSLGITQRSAAINFAWTGDIRKRYTDFLVNEIQKDGTVLHLLDYQDAEPQAEQARKPSPPPKPAVIEDAGATTNDQPAAQPVSEDDRKILEGLLSEATVDKLISLDENIQTKKQIPASDKSIAFEAVQDRGQRAQIHQEIRRIFSSRIETLADGNGIITATPSRWSGKNRGANHGSGGRRGNQRQRDPTQSFGQLGGEYLHFTLYKENKDTMDAINTIARLLKIKASNFGFAGTKDRRAGTVQRVSVYRQRASNLVWLNARIPNIKIGDFKHQKDPLQLGQHGGNEFVITLKNCQPIGGKDCSLEQRIKMIQQSVDFGLAYLRHHGYINYFGLQRFGTYTIGTHLLGMKILKSDYEGVLDDILHVDDDFVLDVLDPNTHHHHGHGQENQNTRDDYQRARAITTWKATKNAEKALEHLPKRFSSEWAIIRHLARNPKDYMGAILSITRGMRMMYIHAYQSYVWNYVVSHRWSKYGATVIEGDLVLADTGKSNGDIGDDEFGGSDFEEENFYAQARALTAEDVASGKYTIFDVVLPTPGYDVMYPRNDIGEYYVEFMKKEENGGLDPYDMRRRQKEFSLSGNYRHIIGRFISDPHYAIRTYSDDTEQMYPTDLDICKQKKAEAAAQARKARQGTSPLLARWAHFADNAAEYDKALSIDRRRKASEELETKTVTTINETWIETGTDGNKRAKVARHHQQLSGSGEKRSDGSPDTTKTFHSANEAVDTLSPANGVNVKPEEPSNLAIGNGVTKPKGISDAYYESIGENPQESPLSATKVEQTAGSVSADSGVTKEESSSDPLGWYTGNMPTIPTKSADTIVPVGATDEAKDSGNGNAKYCGITMPVFRSPSDNPILAPGDLVDTSIDDGKAKKIAVILRFQLKTSNYATVVLRELMGTNAEDGSRFMS